MQTHAIVEIEEGALNVIVGHRRGSEVVVARSVRMPLADLSKASVENALRGIGSDVLLGARGVHVVIGERRVFHQLATLPRLGAKDAIAFLGREVVRQANIATRDDLLLQARLVRRLPGGKLLVGAVAFSRALWRPIAEAFEAQQLEVLSLQTMESCMAMAAEAQGAEPTAILECNGNRARFLLCKDGVAMQVRRFLISGGSSDNEMALATQLTMELPRTLDWLRESGQAIPTRIVIGSRVGLGDESIGMLALDDGTVVTRCRLPVTIADGQMRPDIGLATLLHHLATGGAVASLLLPPKLRLPVGPSTIAAVLGAASLSLLAGYSAVVDIGAVLGQREQQRRASEEVQQLEDVLLRADDSALGVADGAADGAADELQAALSWRRPLSRLLAELSNAASASVHLEELRFASKGTVVVAGTVEGATRQDALAALADFQHGIDVLPYLMPTGHQEIDELPTGYHFRLSVAWRNR